MNAPGDLVQVDTLDLRPLPGVVLKQFTARDVVCRWDVVEVYSVATARTASHFLAALKERSPFPIRAVQVDGGSEFMGEFEIACQGSDLQLFVLPPRSPKLNGHVERALRTHTEELWERYEGDLDLPAVRPALRVWEHLYNTFRPHQALAQRTPTEYLTQCHPEMAPKDHSVSYVVNEYNRLQDSQRLLPATSNPRKELRVSDMYRTSTRTCHGSGHGLDYPWLGEKPSRAASRGAKKADAQRYG